MDYLRYDLNLVHLQMFFTKIKTNDNLDEKCKPKILYSRHGSLDEWFSRRSAKPFTRVRVPDEPPFFMILSLERKIR